MRKLWRGLLLVALLLIASVSVAAIDTNRLTPRFLDSTDLFPQFEQNQPSTSANVIIVPREGEQGESHQIAVDGLQPGETITIRILDSGGTQVYNSSRNAENNGRVQVDIFTTEQDAPGTYTVEVVNSAGNVIGTGTFTIVESSGMNGSISITPESAEAGSTHTFEISNVRPFLDMEVVVLNDVNERVFTTQVRASVDGVATVEYTSTPRDGGTYTVVVRARDAQIASGTLTVEGPLVTTEVTLVPESVNPGEDVIVSITGLTMNETVTVIVTQAGTAIDTIGQTADVNGNVIFFLPTDEAETPGVYDIRVLSDQGITLAQASYTVLGSDVTFVVTPERAPVDNMFVFAVTGLDGNETVTIQLIEDDKVVVTRDVTSDSTGTAVLLLNHTTGLVPGDFTVRVIRDGVAVGQGSIVVEPVEGLTIATPSPAPTTQPTGQPTGQPTTPPSASEPSIAIDPTSGAIPTSYTISVSGVQPGSNITVQIRYQGNVIYSVDGLASNTGTFTTSVASEASDPVGEYTVELVQDGTVVDSMNFSIAAGEAQPTPQATGQPTQAAQPTQPPAQPTQTTQATGNVTINVVPPVVPLGNTFDIRVDGLAPNSEATVSITFQNNLVYDTTRTAESNGSLLINLRTEGTEQPGTYTVTVTQNGTVIATQDFTIGEGGAATTQTPALTGNVSISIDPPTGPVETDHNITVTGLSPNETVQFQLLFGTTVVFDSPRTADANGTFRITMTSNPGDPSGVYTAQVLRGGQMVATAELTITESSALQPQPTQTQAPSSATQVPATATQPPTTTGAATVTIDPASGPVGTTYNFAISGLTPNTNVTIEVRFGGNTLFTTSRTSDTNGNVILSLNTEQGDAEGTYTVVVIENGTQVASGDFVIGAATGGGTTQPQPTQPPAATGDATVTVDPASGPIGTTHTITVSGLTANTNVTLEVRLGDNVLFTTSRTSDANGTVILNLNSEQGDPEGTYTVVVIQNGAQLATGDFVVGAGTGGGITQPQPTQPPTSTTGQATITIDPASGPIGTTHNITISGLTPNANVTVEIRYNGNVVYTTPRTADANGTVSLGINSEQGDPEGTYSVVIIENGTQAATSDFVVGAGAAQPPVTTPGAGTPTLVPSGVTVTVDPQSGPVGTAHNITVTGLEPNENITVDVSFGGASVYSTTRTADATGATAITLTSEEGDSEGQYTITVLRGGTAIASATFTIGQATSAATPSAGGAGTTSPALDLGAGSQVTSGRLTDETPSVSYTFSGQEGETILISQESPDFDTFLILQDDGGRELLRNDDAVSSTNSQIGPYRLPYTGNYTVIASSYSFQTLGENVTGPFNLRIDRVAVSTIAYGSTSTIELNPTSSVQSLAFDAQAGDVISVVVDGAVDTVLTITDTDGFVVYSDDDGGLGFNPEVPRYVVPTSGTYSLLVRSFVPGDAGSIQVTLNRDDVRSLDTEVRTVSLNSKQTSDILTLEGTAGSRINLNVSLLNGEVGNLSITVRQGEETLMFYQTFGMPEDIALGFEVSETGPVNIIVEDFSSTGATLEFSITRSQQ